MGKSVIVLSYRSSAEKDFPSAPRELGSLLGQVRKCEPEILILDITLPRQSGIDLARNLRRQRCEVPIVFLTVHADIDYVKEAFAVGASGYVLKPRLASDLIPALDAALNGERFISPCRELKGAIL